MKEVWEVSWEDLIEFALGSEFVSRSKLYSNLRSANKEYERLRNLALEEPPYVRNVSVQRREVAG